VSCVDLDLDLSGRHVRVDRLRASLDDFAPRLHDELVPKVMRGACCFCRALRVDHELDDPLLVAEVDEHQATVVTTSGDPAGNEHAAADDSRSSVRSL